LVQAGIDQNKDVKIHSPQTDVLRGNADLGTMADMRRDTERKPSFCSNNASPIALRTEKLF
jgi:hypothetical protein